MDRRTNVMPLRRVGSVRTYSGRVTGDRSPAPRPVVDVQVVVPAAHCTCDALNSRTCSGVIGVGPCGAGSDSDCFDWRTSSCTSVWA